MKRERSFAIGSLVTLLDGRKGSVSAAVALIAVQLPDGSIEMFFPQHLKLQKTGGRRKGEPLRSLEGRCGAGSINSRPCARCQKDTLHRYDECMQCGLKVPALSLASPVKWGAIRSDYRVRGRRRA